MRRPRLLARFVAPVALAGLTIGAAAGCSDDGRELRRPGPDQTASITTVATTVAGATSTVTGGATAPSTTAGAGVAPTTGARGAIGPTTTAGGLVLVAPWSDSATIGSLYSCQGQGVSPPLSWSGLPPGAVEVAIVVSDPDAAGFVHWVLAGIDPAVGAPFLGEGQRPPGAVQALNGSGSLGWYAPCPPAGQSHRYDTTLYALARRSGVTDGQAPEPAIAAIRAAAVASVTVTGRFPGS